MFLLDLSAPLQKAPPAQSIALAPLLPSCCAGDPCQPQARAGHTYHMVLRSQQALEEVAHNTLFTIELLPMPLN